MVGKNSYGKKTHDRDLINFDPRPAKYRNTSIQKQNDFAASVQMFEANNEPISNFEYSVKIVYFDYQVSEERKSVLRLLVPQYLDSLKKQLETMEDTHDLSNNYCVHISSTIEQSKSKEWKPLKRNRISASFVQEFSKNPKRFIENYWYGPPDLSKVTAIDWGSKHEKTALEELGQRLGSDVKKCGLFINKEFPQFACSPDGVFQDYLIEIKCPHSLKDTTATNISSLTPSQRKTFFLIESGDNSVELDKRHYYYSQIQWQLFVTGYRKAKFVV